MMGSRWMQRGAIAAVCGVAAAALACRIEAGPRAGGAQEAALPPAISLPTEPPAGAVVLFSGKPEQLTTNFYKRYSTTPANWTVAPDGAATPQKSDIVTKQEFGDCYVHAEFREPADANGNPIGHGNSGVGLQGRYEVQIFNSYGEPPSAEGCGAFYSQTPPMVVASKKAGEWQTYDIIFRAPRLDADGKVVEQPRATVFQNGILVQNNAEFKGPTGIQYGELKGQPKTGPLILQGDHDVVQFRNVWVVPEP